MLFSSLHGTPIRTKRACDKALQVRLFFGCLTCLFMHAGIGSENKVCPLIFGFTRCGMQGSNFGNGHMLLSSSKHNALVVLWSRERAAARRLFTCCVHRAWSRIALVLEAQFCVHALTKSNGSCRIPCDCSVHDCTGQFDGVDGGVDNPRNR